MAVFIIAGFSAIIIFGLNYLLVRPVHKKIINSEIVDSLIVFIARTSFN